MLSGIWIEWAKKLAEAKPPFSLSAPLAHHRALPPPRQTGGPVAPVSAQSGELDVAVYDMYDTLQTRLDRRAQNSWTAAPAPAH